MKLGIEVDSEFLDLPQAAVLELETPNPFLQFDNNIIGSYSLPLEINCSPKNLRLTGYAGLIQKRIDNTGIPAKAYGNNMQHSIGKLKIEKPQIDLNRNANGKISLYYLTGSSSFLQDVKDVKLRSIDMGGDRSFAWTGPNRSGSNGFWQHIHQVIDAPVASYDYAFFPVINRAWEGEWAKTDVMNYMKFENGAPTFQLKTTDTFGANVIVPFPYLKYTLQRIMAHLGWKLQGDILDDYDFTKITLVNFKSIDWAYTPRYSGLPTFYSPLPQIKFNLKDHLPDITVSELLVSLKNRMGWWYDFDKRNKIITIKQLNVASAAGIKDFTKYASPLVSKPINQDNKIYALRSSSGSSPDFKSVLLQGQVMTWNDLPAPEESRYAQVYFVLADNNYYTCTQDAGEHWYWDIFSSNVFDYVPDGANDDITTSSTVLGSEHYDDYLDLIPRMDNSGIWLGQSEGSEWGIHLTMYHGLRANRNNVMLPFGGSGVYDSKFTQVAAWSLCFSCLRADGVDLGLYALQWQKFLETLRCPEQLEATLHLPLPEYLQLDFSDRIIIDNVLMYVKKIKSTIPYKNAVQIEAVRIL